MHIPSLNPNFDPMIFIVTANIIAEKAKSLQLKRQTGDKNCKIKKTKSINHNTNKKKNALQVVCRTAVFN